MTEAAGGTAETAATESVASPASPAAAAGATAAGNILTKRGNLPRRAPTQNYVVL